VQFLEEEGVRVEWTPPAEEEPRGLGADVHQVIVSLITPGRLPRSLRRVRRFRNYGPKDKGKVEVEGEPPGEVDDPDK
jgi:hypothetical protein